MSDHTHYDLDVSVGQTRDQCPVTCDTTAAATGATAATGDQHARPPVTRSRVTGDASPCGGPATPLYRDSSVIVLDNLGPRAQRRGRYVAGTAAHPTRFPPDLAAFLIDGYSWPGHLVLDPLAGTGTALVEAVYLGRNAIGLADDPGWAAIGVPVPRS